AEYALSWFWLEYIQLRKQRQRGRSVAAANVLARLRAHCVTLLVLARAQQLNLEIDALNDRLAATLELLDPARAASTVARLHLEIGPAVAAHFGLDYPFDVAHLLSSG
ncbi:MAG: hypothetical protein JOZ65_08685, partial [Chloroflexi bacterium]|nr:hypothetical protein [Chloroflexota bacterium]